jgi:competence protein ComEA
MLERYRHLIFGGFIVAIVIGMAVLVTSRPPPVTISIVPPAVSATPGLLKIYVTGAVGSPNVVHSLPPGSRAEDAIRAAGGLLSNADGSLVNLAQPLVDGQQLHFPVYGEGQVGGQSSVTALGGQPEGASPVPIAINRATLEDLKRLPDIRSDVAQAILDYRAQRGPFLSMEDLDNVPGIGPKTLEKWQGWISFD